MVMLPDEGYRYQASVYDDAWLAEQGLLLTPAERPTGPLPAEAPDKAEETWTRFAWDRRGQDDVPGTITRSAGTTTAGSASRRSPDSSPPPWSRAPVGSSTASLAPLIRQELEHTSTIDLVRIVMLTEAGLRLVGGPVRGRVHPGAWQSRGAKPSRSAMPPPMTARTAAIAAARLGSDSPRTSTAP
ncbi:hypothetical protein AB5J52_03725 [Streptomyces sp. R39]|uniref:Uncharacterized protein n=1 Tax=Streptomyces sp. R39 TaxID=3238631 RepID=A0AB39QDS4_9ACTN